jgi:hypothetical protein
MRQAERNIVN